MSAFDWKLTHNLTQFFKKNLCFRSSILKKHMRKKHLIGGANEDNNSIEDNKLPLIT